MISTDPQNISTDPGNGIDCTTSERIFYDSTPPTPLPAIGASINLTKDPTRWTDVFNHPDGTQWQTYDPLRGARVGLASGSPMATLNGNSVFPLGAGTSFYRWLGTTLPAKQALFIKFVALANTDNLIYANIRYVDNNNSLRLEYVPSTTTWNLFERIAGVDNLLATAVHDLTADGAAGKNFQWSADGANVTFLAGNDLFPLTYTTLHLTGGTVAFFVHANAANVTGFHANAGAIATP